MAYVNLKSYLHAYLGGLASQLGFMVELGSYDFVVEESLSAYGVDSEDLATNKTKLRSIGRFKLWSMILRELSFDYDFSADGVSSKRSQLFEHVQKMWLEAVNDAAQYLPEYQINVCSYSKFDPITYKRI